MEHQVSERPATDTPADDAAPSLALITPAALTRVLHDAAVLRPGHRVVDATAEPLGVGESMMSDVWRITPIYDEPGAGPATVVTKAACPEPFRREIAERFDFYKRELTFYDALAPLVRLRTPRCYAQIIDAESGDFTLVLEDLSHTRAAPQVQGASWTDAVAVADALASFHASWWDRTDQVPVPVVAMSAPTQIDKLVTTFVNSWPTCRELAGERLPALLLEIGEHWSTVAPRLARRLSEPATLCHGDFRVDNLRFDGDVVIAFDWQLVVLAHGVTDLAYFTSQSMATDERAGRDRELLDRYLTGLRRAGVTTDARDAWDVYRTSVLAMLIFPVALYGGFSELSPLGQATTAAMLDRAVAAIDELSACTVPAIG